jgi:predicted RNA-binding Zn-ribbon protein involved in translation (DUF1610 family)
MSAPRRHRDEGRSLGVFADRVEVRCPRCGQAGTVRADWRDRQWHALFVCAHCTLEARNDRCDWFGEVRVHGRRPCGYCGHQWLCVDRIRPASSQARHVHECSPTHLGESLPVQCPICKRSSEVEIEALRRRGNDGLDPHFGLPLRLVETTRAGLLWAYNAQHLDELRRYIAADQRERRGVANRSMISRLPTWMKLARHRPLMLKSLDRLGALLSPHPRA